MYRVAIEGFREYAEVTLAFDADRAKVLELVEDYDSMIAIVKHQIDHEIIEQGKKRKVIAMHGIGLNHIDVDYARKKGIAVINVPDASNDSVAEFTVGLMINLTRCITPAFASLRAGKWNKHAYISNKLKGKTLWNHCIWQNRFTGGQNCLGNWYEM